MIKKIHLIGLSDVLLALFPTHDRCAGFRFTNHGWMQSMNGLFIMQCKCFFVVHIRSTREKINSMKSECAFDMKLMASLNYHIIDGLVRLWFYCSIQFTDDQAALWVAFGWPVNGLNSDWPHHCPMKIKADENISNFLGCCWRVTTTFFPNWYNRSGYEPSWLINWQREKFQNRKICVPIEKWK